MANDTPQVDFPSSYSETQALFQRALQQLESNGILFKSQSFPVASYQDTLLTTDVVFIPPTQSSKKLLILSSGVHGAEGYAGSALIFEFLSAILSPIDLDSYGVLVVHNVNPFGVFLNRRVNENNVDLNRNFLNPELFKNHENSKYRKLSPFLNPEKPAAHSLWSFLKFYGRSLGLLAFQGMAPLRQAIVGGQKINPTGIFYRGTAPEPQVTTYMKILDTYGKDFQRIFHIDLHTGYGQRGKLHLFSTNTLASETDALREQLFKGYSMDSGKKGDFYRVAGDMTQFTHDYLKGKTVLPMTFEFGTKDSQTLMGSIFSLRTTILENQGFHFGYQNAEAEKDVKNDFSELFYPSSPDWRKKVLQQFGDVTKTSLKRFQSMNTDSVSTTEP